MPSHSLVRLLQLSALGLMSLVAGCSMFSPSQPPPADAAAITPAEQNAGEQAEVPAAEVPAAEIPATEVQAAEVPAPEVGHSDVVWIQERLQELGYYNGSVDGSVGQATQSAVEAYQQDQGLATDGQATAELREFMWRNGG
jgi:peptidoglycan hydrolase-like protein with peptidoglycan-binding domain